MLSIKVSVQAEPRDLESWLTLSKRLEDTGFEALLMGDHPASGASPWPALGAAAAVTTRIKLGTCVLQAGIRDPVQTATDAATLDLLAPGRVLLGLGAGHTYREWEVTGHLRPSPADRAGRLVEFVDTVARLLAGESVSLDGRYLKIVDARLDELPAAGRVILAVGGGNQQVLRLGAAKAQVVSLSGLGRTLEDGHRHEVRWSQSELAAQLELVRSESSRAGAAPEIEALVHVVTATDDRPAVLAELAERVQGAEAADLASTPYVLIGTVTEMAAQLRRQAEQLGIRRYVVREPAVETLIRVLEILV